MSRSSWGNWRSGSKGSGIKVGILNGQPALIANFGGKKYGVSLTLDGAGNTIRDEFTKNLNVSGTAVFDSGATTLRIAGDGISIKDSSSGKILRLINNADNVLIGNPDAGGELTFDSTYSVENIAIGTDAMKNSEYGRWNVFMGYQAGENFGDDCAQGAVVYGNIAIGRRAYRCVSSSNVVGAHNTAIGFQAMEDATGGSGNTCIGYRSGEGLEAGYNTLIGYNAGYNSGSGNITTGTNNICISGGDATSNSAALTNANDDTYAISIGAYCKAGDFAIAMGKTAIASGEDSIAIGIDTDATGAGSIAIGDSTQATADYTISIGTGVTNSDNLSAVIGNTSYETTINLGTSGQNWANTSDMRIKKDIHNSNVGLDFINELRPIQYIDINPHDWPEEIRNPNIVNEDRRDDSSKIQSGFVAQEVKSAMNTTGVTFDGWSENKNSLQRLQYSKFVVPLTKAVQELSAKLDNMDERLTNLEAV